MRVYLYECVYTYFELWIFFQPSIKNQLSLSSSIPPKARLPCFLNTSLHQSSIGPLQAHFLLSGRKTRLKVSRSPHHPPKSCGSMQIVLAIVMLQSGSTMQLVKGHCSHACPSAAFRPFFLLLCICVYTFVHARTLHARTNRKIRTCARTHAHKHTRARACTRTDTHTNLRTQVLRTDPDMHISTYDGS